MKENNKGKKKILIILAIILVLILIIAFIYFIFFHKNKNIEENNAGKLVIVNKKSFNDYEYKYLFNDYIFVSKNNTLGAISKNGEVVIDFIYNGNAIISSSINGLVINDNDKYYLYDKNLKLITETDSYITLVDDLKDNALYYYNNDILYNSQNEKVYSNIDGYFNKVGNYIFSDHNIINLNTKKNIKINYFITTSSYVYASSIDEEKLYLYDLVNDTFKEYKINTIYTNGFSLEDNDGYTYSFTSNYGLASNNKEIDIQNYHFSFNKCSFGFQVYDQDNNLLSEDCYEDYVTSDGSKGLNLLKENNNYILYNNKIEKSDNDTFIIGKYLSHFEGLENSFITLSDLNGKKIANNPCSYNLKYLNNNTYLCENGASSFLVDENLKPKTKEYDLINCLNNSNYCLFKEGKKYGLLFNDEIIIPSLYDNMIISDDYTKLVGESLFNFDIFYLDKNSKSLTKKDLEVNFSKPYQDININDLINEYNLTWMGKTINENEELFKKYAYITLNNNRLNNYQNKVLDLFYEIAINKDYLDEYYLLSSLKKLSITKKDTLDEEGYTGLYYDDNKRIDLLEDDNNVMYHELTHFVDFSFNIDASHEIFKCGDNYLSNNEFMKLDVTESNNCELVIFEEPNFITEGGAEYFSSYYLNKNVLRAYKFQTNIIGALTYIYGFDKLNEIYFSTDGSYKLFMLFNKAGISISEYNNFLEVTNTKHNVNDEDTLMITDILIKLYEHKKDNHWYEDIEFKEIISLLINYTNINQSTSNYQEYLKLNYDFPDKYQSILGDDINNLVNVIPSYMKTKDASYLVFCLIDENANYYYKIFKYDFKNSKALDSYQIDG